MKFFSNLFVWIGLIITGLLCLVLLGPFIIATDQALYNKKLNDKLKGQAEILTTARDVFKLNPNEFICIAQIYEERPSEIRNFDAVFDSGMSLDDLGKYPTRFTDMIVWDPDDIRFMALSRKGRFRGIHKTSKSHIALGAWPHYFGCFKPTYPVKIIAPRYKNSSYSYPRIGFPDAIPQ